MTAPKALGSNGAESPTSSAPSPQARRLSCLHDGLGPQACPSVATLPRRWPKTNCRPFSKVIYSVLQRGSAMTHSRTTSVRGLAAQAKRRRGKRHPHTSEWQEIFEHTPVMYFMIDEF